MQPFMQIILFQGYSVRSIENNNGGNSGPIYMTLSFAGVALMAAMVVGIVVMKKRSGRHPHHQVRCSSVLDE